jgi:hypothetical protein
VIFIKLHFIFFLWCNFSEKTIEKNVTNFFCSKNIEKIISSETFKFFSTNLSALTDGSPLFITHTHTHKHRCGQRLPARSTLCGRWGWRASNKSEGWLGEDRIFRMDLKERKKVVTWRIETS